MKTKICTKCHSQLHFSRFGVNKNFKDGLSYYCKDCINKGKSDITKEKKKKKALKLIKFASKNARNIIEADLNRKLDKNEIIIFIDGNNRNCNLNNLKILSRSECSKLRMEKYWKKQREGLIKSRKQIADFLYNEKLKAGVHKIIK